MPFTLSEIYSGIRCILDVVDIFFVILLLFTCLVKFKFMTIFLNFNKISGRNSCEIYRISMEQFHGILPRRQGLLSVLEEAKKTSTRTVNK